MILIDHLPLGQGRLLELQVFMSVILLILGGLDHSLNVKGVRNI
jgi:hypothetical protein